MLEKHDNEDCVLAKMVEECGALDALEKLQTHENVKIYNLAFKILEKFFSDEVDVDVSPDSGESSYVFKGGKNIFKTFNF